MALNDPLGDMIARIHNAQMRQTSPRCHPRHRAARQCARRAQERRLYRGYASVEHASGRSELEIELKYFDGSPVIREMRGSPSRGVAVYVSVKNLPRINNGLGVAIVVDPEGGEWPTTTARDANVGRRT